MSGEDINKIMDYYLKKWDNIFDITFETSMVFGTGYVKMEWDEPEYVSPSTIAAAITKPSTTNGGKMTIISTPYQLEGETVITTEKQKELEDTLKKIKQDIKNKPFEKELLEMMYGHVNVADDKKLSLPPGWLPYAVQPKDPESDEEKLKKLIPDGVKLYNNMPAEFYSWRREWITKESLKEKYPEKYKSCECGSNSLYGKDNGVHSDYCPLYKA